MYLTSFNISFWMNAINCIYPFLCLSPTYYRMSSEWTSEMAFKKHWEKFNFFVASIWWTALWFGHVGWHMPASWSQETVWMSVIQIVNSVAHACGLLFLRMKANLWRAVTMMTKLRPVFTTCMPRCHLITCKVSSVACLSFLIHYF